MGRFLQINPTGFDAGDMNLFRYCGHDPVNGIDPLGLEQGDMNGQGVEAWTAEVNVHAFYDRFAVAGLFDLFNADGLGQYFNNLIHEPGIREGLSAVGNVLVGENGGEAWSQVFTLADSATAGRIPVPVAQAIEHVRTRLPLNANVNGFHSWHAGTNAELAHKFGLIGAPFIFAAGVYHETPGVTKTDFQSFMDEQSSQGTVNHIIDSVGDINANGVGLIFGYLMPGQRGVDAAIYYGGYIPGPTDFGKDHTYQGDPSQAWGPRK